MSENPVYPVFANIESETHLTKEQYMEMYRESLSDPDVFWAKQAKQNLDWYETWDQVSQYDFNAFIKAFIKISRKNNKFSGKI